MFILYRLDFASGKSYIGQTSRKLSVRIAQHKTAANAGSQLPVHCAWRKHGEPAISVVCECASQEALHEAEIAAIKTFGTMSPGGYNVSHGGDTSPSKAPSVAAKIATKAKGRNHSDKTKAGMSAGLVERWKDPEYQASVSAGLKASWADEMRKAASVRAKARWEKRVADGWAMPEETKAKLRQKVVTDEARANMSAAAKGKVISAETRAKIGAASAARKYGTYSEDRKAAAAAGIKSAWQDPQKRANLMAARAAAWLTRKAKKVE